MEYYKDIDVLNGIVRNDTSVMQYIYRNYYSNIYHFIKRNGGNEDDANDIFQEAIIIIYRKLKANELVLDCSFEIYLQSVSQFLWMKALERKMISDWNTNDKVFEDILGLQYKSLKLNNNEIYIKHFKQLSRDEQKIMQLYYDKVELNSIQQLIGYSTRKELLNKLNKAKSKLKKLIKEDVEYQKTIDNVIEEYIKE